MIKAEAECELNCFAHPPQYSIIDDDWLRPAVQPTEWCGEFDNR